VFPVCSAWQGMFRCIITQRDYHDITTNSVLCLLIMKGQIGLHPATMKMIGDVDSKQRLHIPRQTKHAGSGCSVAFLSEAVYMELYQCLLNADGVITALDGNGLGVGSAVVCVIYTSLSNTKSRLVSGNDTEQGEMFFNELLEVCAREIMLEIAMRASHGAQQTQSEDSASDASADEDGSDSDSNRSKKKLEKLKRCVETLPVTVVGVAGLPRIALVEVEIVAATAMMQTCGITHLQKLESEVAASSSTVFSGSLPVPSCSTLPLTSPLEDMRNMPLWTQSYKPFLPSASNDFTQSSSRCSADADIQLSRCDTVLCCGFIRIREVSCSGGVEGFLDLEEISRSLCKTLIMVARTTLMEKPDLRTLKIFYNPNQLTESDVASAVAICLISVAGISHIVPHVVPVRHLTNPNTVLVAQFAFVNFIQMKTELWVRNR
jgi:hypothetical protein